MASSSGSVYTNYVGSARMRLDWYIDYANNNIHWDLYAEDTRGGGYYRTYWYSEVWIYGSCVYWDGDHHNRYDGDWINGGSVSIASSSMGIGCYAGIGQADENARGETGYDLALYAYFSNQPTLKARTNLSADVYFKPDRNLNATQWRLYENGAWSGWANIGVGGDMVDGSWNGRRSLSYYRKKWS